MHIACLVFKLWSLTFRSEIEEKACRFSNFLLERDVAKILTFSCQCIKARQRMVRYSLVHFFRISLWQFIYFHVALFPYCALFMLDFFHMVLFACYTFCIVIFSCYTVFRVAFFLYNKALHLRCSQGSGYMSTIFMLLFLNIGKYWKWLKDRKHNQKSDITISTVNLFHFYFDIL